MRVSAKEEMYRAVHERDAHNRGALTEAYMDVPRNSALSRSARTQPVAAAPAGEVPGDIHGPPQGRLLSAKDESDGTTNDLDRPKSTILKDRSDAVVPVRTTF